MCRRAKEEKAYHKFNGEAEGELRSDMRKSREEKARQNKRGRGRKMEKPRDWLA
jgi:hypothetical protein